MGKSRDPSTDIESMPCSEPSPAPLLVLPIEERNRELRSRVEIARQGVARGFDVLLGQQWEIFENLDRLPPAVVLFKGNNAVQASNMAAAKRAGHLVCSIEEEAFSIRDDRHFLRLFDPGALAAADLLLAQGTRHADLLRGRLGEMGLTASDIAAKVAVVGNPRVDGLVAAAGAALSDEALRLRETFGRFVLVNTNFASTNPAIDDVYGMFERFVEVGIVRTDDEASLRAFHTWVSWERRNVRAILRVVLRLAAAGVRVVVRPHPSENVDIWRRNLSDVDGVTVTVDGLQVDWLAASSLLLHCSCTTGLEAFLLDHPVLSLTPGRLAWSEVALANLVNPRVQSEDDAVAAVTGHLSGERTVTQDRAAALERMRPFLDFRAGEPSADRVAEAIDRLCRTRGETLRRASSIATGEWRVVGLSDRREGKVAFSVEDVRQALRSAGASVSGILVVEHGESLAQLSRGGVAS